MNKTLLSLLALLFIAGVCVVSCPKYDDHSQTINREVDRVIKEKISENAKSDSDKVISWFASALCSKISEYLIEDNLIVDNYILFSVGKISLGGEEKIISIGALNYIYTDLKDAIDKEWDKYFGDDEESKENPKPKARKTKKARKQNNSESFSQIEETPKPSDDNSEETNEPSSDDYAENIVDDSNYENIFKIKNNTESTTTENDTEQVFTAVEQMPQFPGGDAALMKFISNNINYPQEAYQNGIQGRIIVQLVVKSDGSVGDVKVIRSVDASLDREAIRVCKSLPNFTPGRMNGKAVNVWYTLPITFKLQGSY